MSLRPLSKSLSFLSMHPDYIGSRFQVINSSYFPLQNPLKKFLIQQPQSKTINHKIPAVTNHINFQGFMTRNETFHSQNNKRGKEIVHTYLTII